MASGGGTELWTRQFTTTGDDQVLGRAYDPNGAEQWTAQFGTAALDQALGVAADSSGIYVVGSVGASLPGQISAGLNDAFVRKYSHTGVELWTEQFGEPSSDAALAVHADATGVYVASISASGGYLRKLTPGGTILWLRLVDFGTGAPAAAFGVAGDADGVYIAGSVATRDATGFLARVAEFVPVIEGQNRATSPGAALPPRRGLGAGSVAACGK